MNEKKKPVIIITVVALLLTALVIIGLNVLRPKTKKRRPTPPVPIVKVIKVSPGSEPVHIEASGEVIPAREVVINTEVEGKITALSNEMVPGGIVSKGHVLVSIDPAEYELRVNEEKAALAGAVSKLEIEKGQQAIARQEWAIFEKEHGVPETDTRLALRAPQMRSAEAELDAAESRLASAELALAKTIIRAPFNAMVMEEYAEKGQFAGRQSQIARLAGTDHFWVRASVLPGYIKRITFPSKGKKGSKVRVILEARGGGDIVRTGRVLKLLGDLDPRGRMARILVQIDDPLNLKGKAGMGKILLGSFVKLEIEAGRLDNVYRIKREALTDGERLLILKPDGTLDLRETTVMWRREKDLLLRADISEGERLIVSRLQNPLPGMKLRTGNENK